MFLQRLYLRNFRIFEEFCLEFCKGVNNFYGANARGKTTILEAIHLLMVGRSFRSSQLADLIKEGKDFFFIEAFFLKQGVSQRLKMSWDGKSRRIFYNHTELPSASGLLGVLQGVVMKPDDISLIKGAPPERRAFLDLQIAQTDPLYVHHLTRYTRAVKQRNALLRAKRIEAIEGWEQEMAKSASYIILQRAQILEKLQSISNDIHASIADTRQTLGLGYSNDLGGYKDGEYVRCACFEKWQRHRKRELEIGFTLSGPHKDDFTISIDGKEARIFASEGQQRSCVAALRLGEWETMKERVEEAPLMLIDDFGISLDAFRRQNLCLSIERQKQVFITSTENMQFQSEQRPVFV